MTQRCQLSIIMRQCVSMISFLHVRTSDHLRSYIDRYYLNIGYFEKAVIFWSKLSNYALGPHFKVFRRVVLSSIMVHYTDRVRTRNSSDVTDGTGVFCRFWFSRFSSMLVLKFSKRFFKIRYKIITVAFMESVMYGLRCIVSKCIITLPYQYKNQYR